MTRTSLQGIIFDLDGTLANTLPVCFAAFRLAFHQTTGRIYTDEEITATFGPSEEGAIQRVVPTRYAEALELFFQEYERAHALCTEPFPGIREALGLIRDRGAGVAVVTGKGPVSARISLRILGLEEEFSLVEAGSPTGGIKHEAIHKVLTQWNLPPEAVAYVGDAASDVPAARRAGVLAVAAAWAATADYRALTAQAPDELFDSVEAFTRWIDAKVAPRAHPNG